MSGLRTVAVPAIASLAVVAAAWFGSTLPERPPDPTPADVGFARDMAAHHAQAVQLAELLRARTEDPELLLLATDIALTQQAQIGQMQGWLAVWGENPTAVGEAMRWTGHDGGTTAMSMPGMATAAQLDELRGLDGPAAEELFLRLMVRHHIGGIEMADAALELAAEPPTLALAAAIRDGQAAEVQAMNDLLGDRGVEPEPVDLGGPMAGHGAEGDG